MRLQKPLHQTIPTMKKTRTLFAPLLALLLMLQPATATITGGSISGGISKERGGVFKKLTPPIGNVGKDNHQSPNLFGFDETQNIKLTQDLLVDVLVDKGKIVRKTAKKIASGETVSSHYIFYDPINGDIKGTVRFDSDIIAIITTTNKLKASDFLVITTDATYLNSGPRGIESNDIIRVTGPRKIYVDFTAVSPGDYIRVLTSFSNLAEESASE